MKGGAASWRRPLWWAVPLAALLVLLGIETNWGTQLVRVPEAPPPIEAKPIVPSVLPEYRVDEVAALSETVDRTLFNPTRRPAPPAPVVAGGGPQAIQRGQFVLTGTTVAGDRSIAFLKEVAGGKARTVRRGEKINGMLVAEVTPDSVKFTMDGDSEELVLKVAPGPKATVAVAPAAAPAGLARGNAGLGARRAGAAAAAANRATTGEGAPAAIPDGRRGAANRAARAAAAAAATGQGDGGAAPAAAPAAADSSDPWSSVYQRMQQQQPQQQQRGRGK